MDFRTERSRGRREELFEKIKTNNLLKLMKDFNVHIHKNLHALGKISKNKFLPRHNIEYKTQRRHCILILTRGVKITSIVMLHHKGKVSSLLAVSESALH